MNDNTSVFKFSSCFFLCILLVVFAFCFFSNETDKISLVNSWISSDYEIYINGNPVINDYDALGLYTNCYITGFPDKKKIVCETKSNSSLFALDEALSQQYTVYIDGVKSEGVFYTGDFLFKNYKVSINNEARQILCVKKPEIVRSPVYLPIPIRY
ncbi:hypothetical protein [Clostridium sp. AN503]|uniref:hypothetical protein n=1 Tax=Clostridium sp. AN503 TaxID=3160598 RepID=UPI003459A616